MHKLQILLTGHLSTPLFIPRTTANKSQCVARKRNARTFLTRKCHLFVKSEKNPRSWYSLRATHSQADAFVKIRVRKKYELNIFFQFSSFFPRIIEKNLKSTQLLQHWETLFQRQEASFLMKINFLQVFEESNLRPSTTLEFKFSTNRDWVSLLIWLLYASIA